ncbi:MAG: tetratricopeptide repeat protein [Acidimicrobiia bacterium]
MDGSAGGGAMVEAYERFMEGSRLLASGDAHATGTHRRARAEFAKALELDPVNDYAHFGMGLCLLRTGERAQARGHLKLAAAMRPEAQAYRDALAAAGA